jgi:hypothetical protein
MTKNIFAATFIAASALAGAAFADVEIAVQTVTSSVNLTFGAKAQEAITKTYGAREADVIHDLVTRNLQRELGGKLGSTIERVDVVINDIVPNRPTFKQLGDRPGLSFQSYGIGGADVTGKAYDGAGNLVGEVSYDWYGDIMLADTSWTWTDADRALYQFSRRLAAVVPG